MNIVHNQMSPPSKDSYFHIIYSTEYVLCVIKVNSYQNAIVVELSVGKHL